MKLTRAQKKAQLQAATEAAIEQLLDWDEENTRPNLTAIEEEVLRIRQQLGQEMAALLVEGQETRQPHPGGSRPPACPHCGQPIHYKGRKPKAVASRLGGIAIERGYYFCPACGGGSFPPGRTT